jgi:hypothetical protein
LERTARTTESAWRLLAHAAGTPEELIRKLARLVRALAAYADARGLDRRLELLTARGYIDPACVPTRLQLVVGSLDMLRFWISPAAAQYYAQKGIHFGFHQVLRVLDDPASMVDPTGLLSDRDVIIGHLLQVVHANPCYDLQLLDAHADGLAELEAQLRQMLAGTHPRAASIGAIVEEPDYHQRLLDYVRAYRESPDVDAPIRDNVRADPVWAPIERTFGTLPRAMAYFAKMPTTMWGAVGHLRTVRSFPLALAT